MGFICTPVLIIFDCEWLFSKYKFVSFIFIFGYTGKKLVAEGAQESTNVTFDTIEKVSKRDKRSGPLLPVFKADASKVTIKGMGLKKAFLGKQNQFQVNATDAGLYFSLCSICMFYFSCFHPFHKIGYRAKK